ncbi:hypothetical protein ACP275_08G060900 [Erythranthe tilingii]
MAKNTATAQTYCRDGAIEPDSAAIQPPPTTTCAVVVTRLFGGFTTAFFASLQRCSCINITTADDFADDCGSLPSIPDDIMFPAADVICTSNRQEDELEVDHMAVDIEDATIEVKGRS